jgi:hypothetical protein
MSSDTGGPCGSPEWNARCAPSAGQCVAGSPGQGCDNRQARPCGSCYRARSRSQSSPFLEWFGGVYSFTITDPGETLADEGFQAGDLIRQINDQDVTKALIAEASQSTVPVKVRYFRPGQSDEGFVSVPNLGNVVGFMGLALADPGPLASYGVSQWATVTHINEESVSPDLFIDMADDPEGHATSIIYRDFTFAPRTLNLS